MMPIVKKVMRQPIYKPITRPKGRPKIIAIEVPVATMLSAVERSSFSTS